MDEDFCNDYRFGGDLETSLQTLILPDYLLKKKLPLKAYFLINISVEKLEIKKKKYCSQYPVLYFNPLPSAIY